MEAETSNVLNEVLTEEPQELDFATEDKLEENATNSSSKKSRKEAQTSSIDEKSHEEDSGRSRSHHSHKDSHRDEHDKSSLSRSECCKSCLKESRTNGRACICQVPSSRRRTPLGVEGCITCGCHGCHPEDREAQKEKRDSQMSSSTHSSRSLSSSYTGSRANDNLKNGCCKPCMKAFSETKKACLCQVPVWVRMTVLPAEGCTICKCKGCHPEEVLMKKRGWLPPPNSANAYMYGYYPSNYFSYFGAYADHYSHYNDSRERDHRHGERKSSRRTEDSSRKRERDSERSYESSERRSSRSHHRPRSRSSSPKRSRT